MNRAGGFRLASIAVVAPGGAAIWRALLAIENDRVSALVVGAVLMLCLYVCLGPMRLNLLSPPMLYLCVFALFHLGMALPWALGLYEGALPGWFVSNRLTPALGLVELALASFLAGVLLTGGRREPAPQGPVYTDRFLFWSGVAIYAAGCGMFLLGVRSLGGSRFFEAGYAETYRLAAQFDPRMFGTSFTVVPIGLYLAAASFPRRRRGLVAALTLVWVAGIFFLGFRGFALILALVVMAVAAQRGYRLSAWTGAALAGAMLAAIPMARAMREEAVRQRSLLRSWSQIQLLDGVVEMGGSLRPLVHTLTYVDQASWRWGGTYWQSAQSLWPNLSRHWEGGRYIPFEDLPPNHWLTAQAEPGMYRRYGGLGFSAVAEPYMNFGAAGVVGYFLGLGALLARAGELAAARPAPLALSAMLLGPLLWTTRNSFEIFFRPAVWGVVAVVTLARIGAPLASARRMEAARASAGSH